MLTKAIDWWRWQMLTPEEKYLMRSVDVCDLEYRQKKLVYGYRPR